MTRQRSTQIQKLDATSAELKARDQMEWVRLVNGIRNMAEELNWCRSKAWKTPSGAFGCL